MMSMIVLHLIICMLAISTPLSLQFSSGVHRWNYFSLKASSKLFPQTDRKERELIPSHNETDVNAIKNEFEIIHPSSILESVEHAKSRGWHDKEEIDEAIALKKDHLELLLKLKQAQDIFATMSQEDADKIFLAVAQAANFERLSLAKMAFDETQMGCFEDKVIKNGLACELISDRYKNSKTCGLIDEDTVHGIKKYAHPAGPICALIPVTNPTSTVIAKALMMAKTRNVGIFLPHPKASKVICEAVRICREAGERAGAPEGWLQSIERPTFEESSSIMRSDEIHLILSTGGPGVVKASYESGKPAIGVGGGNAPVLVDEMADLDLACGSIVMGKTFDNGMICAAEQSVVVVEEVYDSFKKLLQDRGVHFLEGGEHEALANLIEKNGKINADIVGKSAKEIAGVLGITVPEGTIVLGTEERNHDIGERFPLSKEKLSPILAMFKCDNFEAGVDICASLTKTGGLGHTAGLYTDMDRAKSVERESFFIKKVPTGRLLVNSPTSLTAIGTSFNFHIDPSFMLGVGTLAGSSVSENLGPMHLINVATVAERQEHIEWFNLPHRLFFNRGCLEEGLKECGKAYASGEHDERVMIISGKTNLRLGYVRRVAKCLRDQGFEVETFTDISADPDMKCIRKGVKACERFQPDLIVCLGGGSPIDAGKFIRVQYEHPELTLKDVSSRFIELRKRTIEFPQLGTKVRRLVAIPTTSGTGSEVSPFTVITDDDGHKYPIASYKLTPDIAICDSTFCDSLPKSLIANSGIDAITHAIEAYVSVAQNDFTKMHSLQALGLLFDNLSESYHTGTVMSRDAVHRGSTIAGIAFSNSFLGVCHSLAHQVGSMFHIPHGLTNGILLPHIIMYNASSKPTRMGIFPSYKYPQSYTRYSEIADHIGADESSPQGLVEKIKNLMKDLNMPLSFKEANIPEKDYMSKVETMAESAFDDQCTPANPRFPLVSELKQILIEAYDSS